MAGFLYYFPSKAPLTRKRLGELGFPHAAAADLPGAAVQRGPVAEPGYVFALRGAAHPQAERPTPIGYYPDHQTWQCVGKWWVGWREGSAPRPIDLQRRESLDGHPVTLRDGHDWIVPIARLLDGTPGLPQTFSLNATGEPVRRIVADYRILWNLAQRIWATMWSEEAPPESPPKGGEDPPESPLGKGGEDPSESPLDKGGRAPLTWEECFSAAALALAVHYRISAMELRALNLLTDDELCEVIRAVVDFPKYLQVTEALAAAQKKSEEAC